MTSIVDLYNSRAQQYDDKTSFHRHLATEYVKYARPQPGESLLDLACGTGLVAFEFARHLQPLPKIVGIDISSCPSVLIRHHHHLLRHRSSPFAVLGNQALDYLPGPGGRLIVDIPYPSNMLSLGVFSLLAPEFGVEVLGNRNRITDPVSLKAILDEAGLEAEVIETWIFEDISARTEEGRGEWDVGEGERIRDVYSTRGGFSKLDEKNRGRARDRFMEE
ncbi:hypothetical protein B0O99DRAFT_686720 [Bisporella sp. PMI_857]|nr:hypothetical protein B0O99DRAFT_686720 [Bisporella sp. PMI_857]